MTLQTYSNKNNATRAARRQLGDSAAPGEDFHLVSTKKGGAGGAQVWRWIAGRSPTVAEEARSFTDDPGAAFDQEKPAKAKPAARATSKAKAKPKAAAKAGTPAAEGVSKRDQVLALLARPKGTSVAEIAAQTGWQAHTIRAFISTVPKKLGLLLASDKVDGVRVYKTQREK